MVLKFKKQIQKKSYQYVVEQIQEAILDNQIEEGERLPSELKLKDMFETSRGTIREALRILEQKGLVSVKTGVKGGAIVQKAGTAPISDSIGLLIRHNQVSLDSLAQFRVLLEGFVASQAAQLADETDIKRLRNILEKAKDYVSTRPGDLDQFHQLDGKFHHELARICRNPLVEVNLKTIHEHIHIYFQAYLTLDESLIEKDFQDLCSILEAIEQKQPDQARDLAENHVIRFNRLMKENLIAE